MSDSYDSQKTDRFSVTTLVSVSALVAAMSVTSFLLGRSSVDRPVKKVLKIAETRETSNLLDDMGYEVVNLVAQTAEANGLKQDDLVISDFLVTYPKPEDFHLPFGVYTLNGSELVISKETLLSSFPNDSDKWQEPKLQFTYNLSDIEGNFVTVSKNFEWEKNIPPVYSDPKYLPPRRDSGWVGGGR